MIELTGISLDERKKELNIKINNAAKNKTNFNEIKPQMEKSDVDKLYKIGVASKYKDVEYLIEILKSGDSLYISTALKSIWLYSKEYSYIINPEYLQENVFPYMSLKMTKKFLSTISMYVRDEERAMVFYTYCNKLKLKNIAMKFLIFTPQSFKLNLLKDDNLLHKLRESNEFLTLFLGNSIDLAEAYYSYSYNTATVYHQARALYQLRYFYSISDVKYLEMIRKSDCHWSHLQRMGLRISKHIMKNHKDQIFNKTMVYLHLLSKSVLVRYSTVDDAKFYIKTLIAHECPYPADFWSKNFCDKYDYILDKIPLAERLQFIKNIFTDQYPQEEFETTIHFYNSQLYKLMTPEERESWALAHVRSDLELLGTGRDFIWYKFVPFDKAFIVIKKYIQLAVNVDTRTEVITVLVESAKTDSELEALFDYYYIRHVNEQRYYKERFVDAILSEHNVYNFNESCWDAFNKILFSLEVYNVLNCNSCKTDYKDIALIYHIIHGKEVPEALTNFIDSGIYFYAFKTQTDKFNKENINIVYQYLLQFYLEKIKSFDNETYNVEVKNGIRKYIFFVLDLMYQYDKPKEDIPEIVNKYIQLDFDEFRNHSLIIEPDLTQQRLIGYLKKNTELVISKLPLIKSKIDELFCFKFNTFLKILRTYFSKDLANVFLNMFKKILVESNPHSSSIKTAVYGIFELADIDFIKDFMDKHVPKEAKIDHTKIDRKMLYIQESICNMICYSRPPIPLSDVTKYIKGDYIHYCLPMFNSYLANLPKPLCLEFVKSLLGAPLSVQKHGLRMAFECFSIDDLRRIILGVWKKTKNVSLRSVIYTYVHNKIGDVDEHVQNELFEDLKSFTSTLNEEDDEEVFTLLTSDRLPQRFIGEYVEVAWDVVDALPQKKDMFIARRKNVINCMEHNIYLIKKEVIESIIYDHVNLLLKQQQMKHNYEKQEEEYLVNSKWNLLYKYVTYFVDDDDFHKKAELAMVVIKESVKWWDKVDNNKYILKQFVSKSIDSLNHKSYKHDVINYAKINVIFEQILEELQDTLPPEEIYEIISSIRICIITRNVIIDGKQKLENDANHNLIIKECMSTYAKEFASLIIESIENHQCYVSCFDLIQDILTLNLRLLLITLNYKDNLDIGINTFYVIVCLELLEYKAFETYMFVSKLLPCNIDDCIDRVNYINVINKLKSCDYKEVKCYMYNKFVLADYIYRHYILS